MYSLKVFGVLSLIGLTGSITAQAKPEKRSAKDRTQFRILKSRSLIFIRNFYTDQNHVSESYARSIKPYMDPEFYDQITWGIHKDREKFKSVEDEKGHGLSVKIIKYQLPKAVTEVRMIFVNKTHKIRPWVSIVYWIMKDNRWLVEYENCYPPGFDYPILTIK